MKKFVFLCLLFFLAAECSAWPLRGKWILQRPDKSSSDFIDDAKDYMKDQKGSFMLEFTGKKVIIRYIDPEKSGLVRQTINKTYRFTSDLFNLSSDSPDLSDINDPFINRIRTGIAGFNYQIEGNYIFIDTTQGYQVLEIKDRNTLSGSYLGIFKRIEPLPGD